MKSLPQVVTWDLAKKGDTPLLLSPRIERHNRCTPIIDTVRISCPTRQSSLGSLATTITDFRYLLTVGIGNQFSFSNDAKTESAMTCATSPSWKLGLAWRPSQIADTNSHIKS